MNTCPGLDTAVYPCWIPRETRHGTREKHIIRGVHLREPVRCYWRKTSRGTHLRLCFWLILLLAGNFFFLFFLFKSVSRLWTPRQWTLLLQHSGSGSRRGHGRMVRMVSSARIILSFLVLLCCSSPANGKQQSFTLLHMCAGETLGRPDRTGWMLFKLGSNQFTYK